MKPVLTSLAGWAMWIMGFGWGDANAQPAAPAKAIIVFDASGSMYGEVPGGVKIDIAKKVVTDILASVDPKMELGLMAYGHRRKGDCDDIELLVPPKADSAAEIAAAVAALQPKGKTPLTSAVIQAARFLKYEETKASVILISDGVETCDKNPCAAAEELERLGVDFTCHVIGFDLKEGESAGLECLAKKTGGMYLSAKDAASLKISFETAMKQVVKPATTLIVEARKSSGGDFLEGVSFELFAEGAGENAIAKGSGGRWITVLPKAGSYTISAKYNGKSIELDAALKEGGTVTKEVVFAETGIKAVAYDKAGGTAYDREVGWELYGPADGEGKRVKAAFSYDAKPFMRVAAGKYLLKATRGQASASVEAEVKEGAPQELKLILGSGDVKLRAIAAEGQASIDKELSWDVFSPPDAEGQRKKLGFSYDAQPKMTLPSGPCLVVVQHGNARGQKEIEVKAGETLDVVVLVGSGKIKLAVLMEEGGKPVEKDVAWDVYGEADAEGNRPKAGYSYDAQPTLTLPAGTFDVEAQVGNAKGRATVVIEAGKSMEKTLVLGAGRVRFSALAVDGSAPIASELSWDVFGPPDADGNRTKPAYSYDAQPTINLPAGKYTVQVQWGGAFVKKDFEISAGKLVEVPVTLNAGTIALSALMAQGADPSPNDLSWDLFAAPNAEGERSKAGYSYDAQPKFHLVAGKYLVTVKRGAATVNAEVEVMGGKTSNSPIILNAGMLSLSSATPGGWDLFGPKDVEGNRKKIFYSYDANLKVAVSAGKVLVVRSENQKKAEQEVDVKANTLTELKLDAK